MHIELCEGAAMIFGGRGTMALKCHWTPDLPNNFQMLVELILETWSELKNGPNRKCWLKAVQKCSAVTMQVLLEPNERVGSKWDTHHPLGLHLETLLGISRHS